CPPRTPRPRRPSGPHGSRAARRSSPPRAGSGRGGPGWVGGHDGGAGARDGKEAWTFIYGPVGFKNTPLAGRVKVVRTVADGQHTAPHRDRVRGPSDDEPVPAHRHVVARRRIRLERHVRDEPPITRRDVAARLIRRPCEQRAGAASRPAPRALTAVARARRIA